MTTAREWVHNGFRVGPNYCPPPGPVAEDWVQRCEPRIERGVEPPADWWCVFEDPVLTKLVYCAAAENRNLRAACARVLQARALRSIAVGNLFPQTQTLGGQYSRIALSRNRANNPTEINEITGEPLPSPFTNFFSNWLIDFNVSWELDIWGRIRRNIESADANLDASVADYDAVLVTLLADVATNYTQYRVARQRIQIAEANVEIQQASLELAEARLREGVTTRLDVEQARTALEQTRSTIPLLRLAEGQANDALCVLLGMPPHELACLLGPAPDYKEDPLPKVPTSVAAGIPADLLRRRPDVRALERQVAAQSARIGVAEADFYPTLVIVGVIGLESENFGTLFNADSFFGSITPSFRWNILNYGRIWHNVRYQEALFLELVAAYQQQVLVAGREAQVALRAVVHYQEQTRYLKAGAEAAGAATEVGLLQYRAGLVPFNTVFILQAAQLREQDNLAVARGNTALALIDTYRALGGGWQVFNIPECCGVERPVVLVPATRSPQGPTADSASDKDGSKDENTNTDEGGRPQRDHASR